jgi:hypothetical protein
MEAEQLQIIDRIRKLLALSESSNESEAALAAARAQELLQKHNLNMGIIEDTSQQTAEQMATDWLGTRLQPHIRVLARACNEMFDTCCFYSGEYVDSNSWRWHYKRRVVFIGLRANTEAAVVTHSYLCAAVNALSRQRAKERAIHGNSGARDYKLGAAQRISHGIHAHKLKATATDPGAAALVRVGRDIAQRALDEMKLGNGRGYAVAVSDADAFNLGLADGAKVNPYAARSGRMLSDGQ